MMVRIIAKWLTALVILTLLLLLIPVWLVTTQSGSQWALQQGLQWAGIDAGAMQIRGSLWRGLTLEQAHYRHDAVTVKAESLSLTPAWLALRERNLHVLSLEARELEVLLTPAPKPQPPEPLTLPVWDIRLPITITLDTLAVEQFRLVLSPEADATVISLAQIQGQARWDETGLHISRLEAHADEGTLALQGQVLPSYPYPLSLQAQWQLALPEALQHGLAATEAQGNITLDGDLRGLNLAHQVTAPLTLSGHGQINDPLEQLFVDLQHHWQMVQWHGATEQENLQLAPGSLHLRGDLAAYQLSLSTQARYGLWPTLALELSGQGQQDQFRIAHLLAVGEPGRIQLDGVVHWQPSLRWELALQGEQLNPAALAPEFPGDLRTRLRTHGRMNEAGALQALLDIEQLQGELRSYPVQLQGKAELDAQRVQFQDIEAGVGRNRLRLAGTLGLGTLDNAPVQLDLDLNAPDLAALWPELSGQLQARGQIQGTALSPTVQLRANATALGYQDHRVETLALNFNGGLGAQQPLDVQLSLRGVALGEGLSITEATLQGQGQQQQHRIQLDLHSPEGQLGLSLAGGLDASLRWQGQLTRLNLEQAQAGRWQLLEPAALALAAEAVQLRTACLRQDAARLCLEGQWQNDGSTQAQMQLSGVDLQRLKPWLGETIEVEGALSAQARLQSLNPLAVTARLELEPGKLHVPGAQEGERLQIAYRDTALNASLQGERLDATLVMDFLEQGTIRAGLVATQVFQASPMLDAQLNLALPDLHWLQAFVPQTEGLQGRLAGDLQLQGPLRQPSLRGALRLDDGQLMIPEAGIALSELHTLIRADNGDSLAISGSTVSGDGQLHWEGVVNLQAQAERLLDLQLHGENFTILNRPDIQAQLSPQLTLHLAQQRLQIDGQVRIPQATLALMDLPPQAVRVSGDEVIIDQEIEEAPLPVRVEARVQVFLGDQVSLSGYGLQAMLAGDVRVESLPERPTRVVGEIQIREGRYKSYGQDLRVAQGRLIFQGPPDNPGLDVRAERRIPVHDVVAGLEIGGTLAEPRSRVYATPPMEESDAMAYLLTGRPLSGASAGEGNLIAEAITLYGIERGAFITEHLASQLGLDELSIDADGGLEETALMMGKQLSPRLYLRYTVGLVEQGTNLLLRYTLTPTLSLETRSGQDAQSMDLIFRKER
ncbi:translocation/assembly module TamB domain-containing protein [Thiorhodospira sibirica]|uniref:translocation/assembly module TamB domain-containing protein n=1 Tax=Thiorhodospira sibirica TaxID=154347 RepID=UPI00022C286D|nr:translocation/assembly module TamB domain-containing protein [Thiorhodospira sibirica]